MLLELAMRNSESNIATSAIIQKCLLDPKVR